ncbi:MAG: hypothetical protein IBJ01_13645 [Leptospira sp.]|uniref:LamG domain-containing protein n=1 Tax=Leptospira paudalimensis TaxID=2950024 RepID=A0ABT3MA86_9LEPT|nr:MULTISPECIES: hypothetical protein [Leptospira]MBL0955808.1 hypothetical protein [Leptospira sp.]MCW7505304.1 hypothetical protein [Leptospira paudalimensis]
MKRYFAILFKFSRAFKVILFPFFLSCQLDLNSPYEFGTDEYYKTQFLTCLINRSSVCVPSGPFDLNQVPGRRLWIRAEGLTFTNGAAVTNWSDLSGTGNDLIPGVAPTFYSATNTINGKPIVRFLYGSGNNLLKTSPVGVSTSDSGSVFFVVRLPLTVNSNVLTIGPSGTNGREFQITSLGAVAVNKSGSTAVATYNSGWVANAVHQVSILQNGGTNVLIKFDGVQVVSTVPAATGYAAGNLGLGIGGAEMDLAELLYFDNRVSDENATNIDCYLGKRYGTFNCP